MKPDRLSQRIRKVLRRRQKLFCAFLTLGFPNLRTTERLIREFDAMGVDIIELGFPFSDPLADGPTIQASSEAALRRGVRLRDAFSLVKRLRADGVTIPIVFFGYLNPIFHYGEKKFLRDAQAAGFDGVLIPDLPIEEEAGFRQACQRRGFPMVFLVSPTTDRARAGRIGKLSRGFIYYVSVRGVTGARKTLSDEVERRSRELRRVIRLPILIGFGVSDPVQAAVLSRAADGVIVGSAIIRELQKGRAGCDRALRFVKNMLDAVKRR
ncbi:MAG: tryptophan synthase subunit alpha [Candidatus Omnitrophota bacterium]